MLSDACKVMHAKECTRTGWKLTARGTAAGLAGRSMDAGRSETLSSLSGGHQCMHSCCAMRQQTAAAQPFCKIWRVKKIVIKFRQRKANGLVYNHDAGHDGVRSEHQSRVDHGVYECSWVRRQGQLRGARAQGRGNGSFSLRLHQLQLSRR